MVAVQFAGQLIGYQMGFAIVNVLDPHSQTQISLIGEFLFAVVMLSFLNLNLHHDLIGLWYQSYDIAPPGGFAFASLADPGSAFMPALVRTFDDIFYLALKISLPLVAFLLLADLALGIIARIMPQMNVFIVGIPLKVAVGLFFMSLVVLQFDPVVRQMHRALHQPQRRDHASAGEVKPPGALIPQRDYLTETYAVHGAARADSDALRPRFAVVRIEQLP